jgi:YegS/Rv2252/BmrU family lipid kinase
MNVRVIANPVAGGGRGRVQAEALASTLECGGAEVELVLTQQAGDAEPAAARSGADVVVAVGGDGSINEVVNGLTENDSTLAILPMGTANVVARELRLPRDPAESAALILQGKTMPMDAGLRNGRRFLLGAGAGLDAAVAEAVSRVRGKKSSFWKWVGPSIRTALSYAFPAIRVTVDGEVVSETAQYAVVGNCRYSAGVFPVTPRARIDDGLLDVCLFHDLNAVKLAWLAALVRNPSFIERKDIVYRQGKRIAFAVAGETAAPLQVDGDPAGRIPADFEVEEKAVSVITPRAKG